MKMVKVYSYWGLINSSSAYSSVRSSVRTMMGHPLRRLDRIWSRLTSVIAFQLNHYDIRLETELHSERAIEFKVEGE